VAKIPCPKCGYVDPTTWRDYLKKAPGNKVHFMSNVGKDGEILVTRTRLHYGPDVGLDVVEASLRLVAADHKGDPFFRWIDVPTGTIEEVLMTITRRRSGI
jgi:hypothetical protein